MSFLFGLLLFSSKISIYPFFIISTYFLVFSMVLFILRVFTLTSWNKFITAVRSLSGSFIIYVSFPIKVEIFLVLTVPVNFRLYSVYFNYYSMRLWVLFKSQGEYWIIFALEDSQRGWIQSIISNHSLWVVISLLILFQRLCFLPGAVLCVDSGQSNSKSLASYLGWDPYIHSLGMSLGIHEQPNVILPLNHLSGLLLFSPLARNLVLY